MASVIVDRAAEGQLADIAAIELAGASLFSEADLPLEVRYRVTPARDLRAAFDQGRLWTAARDGGALVGFAMADIVDAQGYLAEVDVLPEFGRQGIGTRLVNAVAGWARDNQLAALTLVTFRDVPWNAPFYARLGFEPMRPTECGPELGRLMVEEGRIGIDTSKRVAMKLAL